MSFFMSRDIPFNPELTPPLVNFSNFQAEEHLKKKVAAPWLFNFAKEFLKICLKDKTKSHELLSMIGL